MVPGIGAETTAELKPGRFQFFISYANEDEKIANAVLTAIKAAMGPSADVFMDVALSFGVGFEEEIKRKLHETNVLVVIHSGILKPALPSLVWNSAFSWASWKLIQGRIFQPPSPPQRCDTEGGDATLLRKGAGPLAGAASLPDPTAGNSTAAAAAGPTESDAKLGRSAEAMAAR